MSAGNRAVWNAAQRYALCLTTTIKVGCGHIKRLIVLLLLICTLLGCSSTQSNLDGILTLRNTILHSKKCTFIADITADYKTHSCQFKLDCVCDSSGNISFTVLEPESVAGLKGTVSSAGGELVFDDTVLAFPSLIEEELSPVSAPMIMMQALRSGYIRAAGVKDSQGEVIIDDSYEGEALQMDLTTDSNWIPVRCELIWNGTRILSIHVENFQIT